ncbi:TadE/TadG family type IV pilus assembly protein [Acidocella sp.]|uniref:TadE/TadG family type IV pilus assembly protein n=1 Tax=Acidocella sp. TaxID=50710 RepID=UPI00260B79A0|nr:TadE family protein [Acidocella sp.]
MKPIFFRFRKQRRASAAIEFALVGLAFMAFVMAFINIGFLAFSLDSVTNALKATVRWASIQATNGLVTSSPSLTEPCLTRTISTFNGFDTGVPAVSTGTAPSGASGTISGSPLSLTVTWSGSGSSTSVLARATYNWQPLGFAEFSGLTFTMSAIAPIVGSASQTVAATCK